MRSRAGLPGLPWLVLLLLLLPCAAPCPAQDDAGGDDTAKEEEQKDGLSDEQLADRLVAAAWCAVRPAEARGTEPEEGELTCDAGFGAAIWKRGHLAAVIVVGAQSAGPGVAYVFNPGARRPIAIAGGVVLPWDSTAIYMEPTGVLGITVSFLRGGSE